MNKDEPNKITISLNSNAKKLSQVSLVLSPKDIKILSDTKTLVGRTVGEA